MARSSTTASRPDPPASAGSLDLSPEFLTAREHWNALRLRMRELNRQREELQTAIYVSGQTSSSQPPHVEKLIAEIDPTLLVAVRRNPRKVGIELRNLIDELTELQPSYGAEHEAYETAKRTEAGRIAALFRDRHREAVIRLAGALEGLNHAIEAERSVRRAYAQASPEPTSAALPDLSSDLADTMDLAEWHSVASVWARRVRSLGFSHD